MWTDDINMHEFDCGDVCRMIKIRKSTPPNDLFAEIGIVPFVFSNFRFSYYSYFLLFILFYERNKKANANTNA